MLMRICLLFGIMACIACAADKTFKINKSNPNVKGLEKCGDGNCFSVEMSAPGKITGVDFSCKNLIPRKDTCGHVWRCPDGRNCGKYTQDFVLSGRTATFYGRTNDGTANAAEYTFVIHYE